MSEKNGDKARFGSTRQRKLLRRKSARAFQKLLEARQTPDLRQK